MTKRDRRIAWLAAGRLPCLIAQMRWASPSSRNKPRVDALNWIQRRNSLELLFSTARIFPTI